MVASAAFLLYIHFKGKTNTNTTSLFYIALYKYMSVYGYFILINASY